MGAPAKNTHLFVDAVLYRYWAGIPWRDLPERFGDFRGLHLRHMRWGRRGVWQRVFAPLAEDAGNESGQASDMEGADALLKDTQAQTVIADKGYDVQQRVVQPLLNSGKAVVIPSISTRRVQRQYDKYLHKTRHLIENFFARLKQYRAIATRYDKSAAAFFGAIHWAAVVIWLI